MKTIELPKILMAELEKYPLDDLVDLSKLTFLSDKDYDNLCKVFDTDKNETIYTLDSFFEALKNDIELNDFKILVVESINNNSFLNHSKLDNPVFKLSKQFDNELFNDLANQPYNEPFNSLTSTSSHPTMHIYTWHELNMYMWGAVYNGKIELVD